MSHMVSKMFAAKPYSVVNLIITIPVVPSALYDSAQYQKYTLHLSTSLHNPNYRTHPTSLCPKCIYNLGKANANIP
jgi:hypothetical protein